MLEAGVKGEDLPQWHKILTKAGIGVDELCDSLDKYTSAEALTRARSKRAAELQTETAKMESQVKALTKEQEGLHAAIEAVKNGAMEEVRGMGKALIQEVRAAGRRAIEQVDVMAQMGEEYAALTAEAATLRAYIEVARAMRLMDDDSWRSLPTSSVQALLHGIRNWAQADERDRKVPAPDFVSRSSFVPSYASLKLSAILLWALRGTLNEEERLALDSR